MRRPLSSPCLVSMYILLFFLANRGATGISYIMPHEMALTMTIPIMMLINEIVLKHFFSRGAPKNYRMQPLTNEGSALQVCLY